MEVVNQQTLLAYLSREWKQGEHVSLIGQTGTGKTTLAANLLQIRQYVVITAVKRRDDTVGLFARQGYKTIKKWPPDFGPKRFILWVKPESLSDDLGRQRKAIHRMLNMVYLDGGWCLYLDDTGYLASTLHLGTDIGVLLNQARSNKVSVVVGMTRPTSVIARIPKETLTQTRHSIIFKYSDEREIENCAHIVGINKHRMFELQSQLKEYPRGNTDALYFGRRAHFFVTP